MVYGELFAGIGGMSLGLDRAGLECRWQVENDPFCNKILEKHWPHVKRYGDIRTVSGYDLEPVDLLAGGFPCTDLSQAGKRVGLTNPDGTPTRSGLWFEFARIIGELRPRYVLVENVPGLLVYDGMRRVIGELSRHGYVGIWRSLRASEFGASHLRKRIFIIATLAHADSGRWRIEGNTQRSGNAGEDERRSGELPESLAYRQDDGSELREGSDPLARRSVPATGWTGRGLPSEPIGRSGVLADGERERGERWGDDRILEGAAAAEHREAQQRQRDGHAADDSVDHVAYPNGGQREQLRRPVKDEREVLGLDGGGEPLGNSAGPRWKGRPANSGATGASPRGEQGGLLQPEHGCDPLADTGNGPVAHAAMRDGEFPAGIGARPGEAQGAGPQRDDPGPSMLLGAFAPGPSDPRWGTILRERPDLAPALSSPKKA